jgi:hypothetical protein
LCTASFATAAYLDAHRVKVFEADTVTLLVELEKKGYDVAGRNGPEGFVEVIVSTGELEVLQSQGYAVEVVESYAGKTTQGIPAGYHDYDAIRAILMNTADNFPLIAQLVDVGVEYGVGTTYEGRHLYALKISDNVANDEDEPNVFIVSNHHAREIMTPEFALWIIEKLTTLYGTDPDVTRWVDHNQIYVAPNWNPDGLEYCFNVYEWWRKNRTPFGGGDYGVDLNRNYDFNWYGPYSGSTDPGSDTYKGPYPESEQETQSCVALMWDRHFAKALDFHSYGSEVLYTYYLSSSFPSLIENWFKSKAEEFAYALNYNGNYRKASAEGEHYQNEICDAGAFSFLVETGYEFQPSFSTAVSEFADHIWPGVQWFLDHEIPLRGHVTEAVTGQPIEADIALTGINYTQGETRKTEPRFGRYHYFLPPGTHEVTFSAPGYDPRTFTVEIKYNKSTLLEVQLGQGPQLTVKGNANQTGLLDIEFDWAAGAGQTYWNGISFSNTGFYLPGGIFVPIGWDALYQLTLGVLPGWMGTLDASGHASAALGIPHDPNVVGLQFYMAYFTVVGKKPTAASAAVKVFIDA